MSELNDSIASNELHRLCGIAEQHGYTLADMGSWKGFYVAIIGGYNGEHGIVDSEGNIIIPFKYGYIGAIDNNGVAMASINGYETDFFIHISEDGTVFSPNQYVLIEPFDEETGVARARLHTYQYGVVNSKGETAVPFVYRYIFDFIGGYAVAEKGKLSGVIDIANNVSVPFVYKDLNQYDNGLIVASKRKYKGIIDRSGDIIVPFIYTKIYEFRYGLAAARKDNGWGIIDEKGNVVIPFIYESINSFNNSQITSAVLDGKYGWIDKTGHTVVPFEYELVRGFVNNLGLARKNGKYGYISADGVEVVPFIYDSIAIDDGDGGFICNGVKNLGGNKYYFKDGGGNTIEFEFYMT